MSESEENLYPQKPKHFFGTRHCQVLLMAVSLMIGNALNLSLAVAIIAMTDSGDLHSNFKHYKWTNAQTSMTLSSFLWGYACLQIPSAYVASVWSAKKLLSLGLLLSGAIQLALPLLVYHGDWLALCCGRVCQGLCQACFTSCTHTLLSRWAPPDERSRMGSFVTTGSVLGSVLSMAFSGLIASSPSLGWPGIFYIFGAVAVAVSALFYLCVYDSPEAHPRICPIEAALIARSFEQVDNHCVLQKESTPWRRIFSSVPVWALIVTECGSNWGTWTIATQTPLYMKNILNFDLAANGLISMLPNLANWLLSFPFSWLSDYAMRRDVSCSRVRRVSNTVGMWGSALALVTLCLVSTANKIWPIFFLVLAVGLKAGTASGYIVNQIDLSPNFAGTIYSITTCIGTMVSMLAPIACGAIVQDSRDVTQWHLVYYLTAIIYFCTNLVYLVFGRGKIRSWNDPSSSKKKQQQQQIATISDPKQMITV